MPLTHLQNGQKAILRDIEWGIGLRRKLYDMGLTPGTTVSLISGSGNGPVLLDVRGSRLALGRQIVEKIEVEPVA